MTSFTFSVLDIIISLFLSLLIIFIAYKLGRFYRYKEKKQILLFCSYIILILELIKFIYLAVNKSIIFDSYAFRPSLYTYDLFIVASILSLSKKRIRNIFLDSISINFLPISIFGIFSTFNISLNYYSLLTLSLLSLFIYVSCLFLSTFTLISKKDHLDIKYSFLIVLHPLIFFSILNSLSIATNYKYSINFYNYVFPYINSKNQIQNVIQYQNKFIFIIPLYIVLFYAFYELIKSLVKKCENYYINNSNYDPKTNKYPYTKHTDEHYLKVKKNNGLKFDKDYQYIDNSFSFKFKSFFIRLLLVIIVFPLAKIRLGLKIIGKENIYKNVDIISKGVVSVSNHIHMWDYISILKAISPFKSHVLVWDKNMVGENATLIRLVGGIPIPEKDIGGTLKFFKETDSFVKNGGFLHICPEGSMWEYYKPIRPFKMGLAHYALFDDKPILPIAFSYRKPNFIRRKVFKQIACLTLNIGDLIYIDKSLPKSKQSEDLVIRVRDKICHLAFIKPEENLYPQLFDNNERIDYYTDKYGVGYKGSY